DVFGAAAAAALGLRLVAPDAQGDAQHLVALLLEQRGGRRRIDSSAHGHHDAHARRCHLWVEPESPVFHRTYIGPGPSPPPDKALLNHRVAKLFGRRLRERDRAVGKPVDKTQGGLHPFKSARSCSGVLSSGASSTRSSRNRDASPTARPGP